MFFKLFLFFQIFSFQDLGGYEEEYDIMKSIENIDKYFEKISDDDQQLDFKLVLDILLITFIDSNIKEVQELLYIQKHEKINEEQEEKIHFFHILNHFFQEKYRDQNITKNLLRKILKNMELKNFIIEDIIEKQEIVDSQGLNDELDENEF